MNAPLDDPALAGLDAAAAPEPVPGPPRALPERPVQLRGSALARRVLRLLGWQLDFDGLPALQGVIVVYPHTSNWDFPIGLLAKWAMGMPATFWGKDSLFRVPLLGRWMRYVGGRPVVRSAPQGLVGQMVQAMQEARSDGDFLWLVLAPEGTRSLAAGWRTGFWRVAVGAGVPVGVAAMDFGRKHIVIRQFFLCGGDVHADFAALAGALEGVRGARPALASPVRPL